MTQVILNGTIKGLRGKLGNLIFRQLPNGTTVVTQAPPRKNSRQKKRAKLKRSPLQKAHNERFRQAVCYARLAQHTQPVYAELAAAAPMKTAYNFALRDWLHAPRIHCIERQDGSIRVEASDEILVSRLQVTVLSDEGNVLEKGEAVRAQGNWWEYASQTEGSTVVVEAWDLAGNVTRSVSSREERAG